MNFLMSLYEITKCIVSDILFKCVTMGDSLNRQEVEKFLITTTREVMAEMPKDVTSTTLNQLGTKLVEVVNSTLSNTCPTTEGFKFVVHATVQEQWGQGSLVGAKCEWDTTRDQVVSVDHKTDKVSVCLVVFFVHIEEEDSDSDDDS